MGRRAKCSKRSDSDKHGTRRLGLDSECSNTYYLAVSPRLHEELKQARPWGSLQEEAALNIARTAAVLEDALIQALKPLGITPTQYNVLRILRGAGPGGLCRNEVGERLIRPVPDVTRLLDRLEQLRLIDRRRVGDDKRFVSTFITPDGLALLTELDGEITSFHQTKLGHLTDQQLQQLVSLLESVRECPD
jgi:DNA-binding MarR family transcriptional regulator